MECHLARLLFFREWIYRWRCTVGVTEMEKMKCKEGTNIGLEKSWTGTGNETSQENRRYPLRYN
jgi:hypothetical protein